MSKKKPMAAHDYFLIAGIGTVLLIVLWSFFF